MGPKNGTDTRHALNEICEKKHFEAIGNVCTDDAAVVHCYIVKKKQNCS